ncbi:MAG: glutamate--tRNA ligase family protein [Asticcacaulis sp.]
MQLSRGLPPVYDRAALNLSDDNKAKFEADGRKPHWRFKLDGKRVAWEDLVRGPSSVDTTSMSDPVLIREDGAFLYTLPSVVDDMDMRITHVIRGEDHVANTGTQLEIFEALQDLFTVSLPQFAHMPLLVGADGEGPVEAPRLDVDLANARGRSGAAGHRLAPRQDRHLRSAGSSHVARRPGRIAGFRQDGPRSGALRFRRPDAAERRRAAAHDLCGSAAATGRTGRGSGRIVLGNRAAEHFEILRSGRMACYRGRRYNAAH